MHALSPGWMSCHSFSSSVSGRGASGAGAGGGGGLHRVAILDVPTHHRGRTQRGESGIEPGRAADHRVLAGNDPAPGLGLGGNQTCGEVAGADIFGQGSGDVALDFDAKLFREHDQGQR